MQRFTSRLLNLIASAESSDDGARSGFEACWCKRCPYSYTPRTLLTSPTRSVVSLSGKIYTHTHAHAHSISRMRSYLL